MPQIDFMREEVKRQLKKWGLVRDCVAGQEQVKSKTTTYLPMPNADDTSTENKKRYDAYVLRANFLNATGNTLEGLVGQVFSADPVMELPADMQLMEEDVDGTGVTLTQRAKSVLRETLSFGRVGLLVDFPKAFTDDAGKERDFSRSEMTLGMARANLLQFQPQDVINWRTKMIGGKSVLSRVVIEMDYVCFDDGFELKTEKEWRVLSLDVANEYVCEVWRKSTDQATMVTDPFVRHDVYKPRDYTGKALTFIPFTFVGSLNNNDSPDKPPIYDIAVVNVAHYRNSADYEDNIFMLGQSTPVAIGITASYVKDVWKNEPMRLGSRGVIPLPPGGDFKVVAAEANGMVKEGMDQKEKQMAMLGAQLVEQQEVQRTLGEAQMEKSVVASVLVQCAKNSAAAIQTCLRWASLFYGASEAEGIVYELSTDFAILQMTPEERKSTLAEWQGGLLSFEEARNQFRQSGIAYLEDKVAKAQIDQEMKEATDMDAENNTGGAGDDNAD